VDYPAFRKAISENQPSIRVCSFMPSRLSANHPYLPEQRISGREHDELVRRIDRSRDEGYVEGSLECSSNSCELDMPQQFDS
jgi:hypothetical protein